MTTLFKWNDAFLTGLPSVDQQHQRLVGMINDLGDRLMSSDTIDPEVFATARDALLDYTKVHFSDEESQMDKIRMDPRHVDLHRADHQSFVNEVLALSEIGEGISVRQVRDLADYLVNWLAYHILGVDQSMARQARAIKEGLSPAEAYEKDANYVHSGTEPLLAALGRLLHMVSERNALNRELDHRVRQRTAELERANKQLRTLSIHDDLTGLYNRRYAISALNELWAEARRDGSALSILILDVDRFKPVNDSQGHAVGDDLLRALATRLRDSVRTSDIVCRLGGDEFLVICPRSSGAGAVRAAEKILATRENFYNAQGKKCWDGALSIGVAEATPSMVLAEDLLKAADDELYNAKRQGGARMSGGVS